MSHKRPHVATQDKNAVLCETWKSVHELKAGLKRTEDKIASLKNIKFDSLFLEPGKSGSAQVHVTENFARHPEYRSNLGHIYPGQNGATSRNRYSNFRYDPIQTATSVESFDLQSDISSVSSTKIRILNDECDILKTKVPNKRISSRTVSNRIRTDSLTSSELSSLELDNTDKDLESFDGNGRGSSVESFEQMKLRERFPETRINPFFIDKTGISSKIPATQIEKLKQLIERQATNHFNNIAAKQDEYEPPSKVIHNEDDVVKTSQKSWFDEETCEHVKKPVIRKIVQATGPDTYKGFSSKKPFFMAFSNPAKNLSLPVKSPSCMDHRPAPKPKRSSKVRKIAPVVAKQKSIITPASWKEIPGVVFKRPRNEKPTEPTRADTFRPKESRKEEPSNVGSNVKQNSEKWQNLKSMSEKKKSDENFGNKAEEQNYTLDHTVQELLKKKFSIHDSKSYEDADQNPEASPKKLFKPKKGFKKPGFNQKKQSPIKDKKTGPKVVHYDAEKVRQYIDTKKAERHRKLVKERLSKKEEEHQKRKRLEALYQRQKRSLKSSLNTEMKMLQPSDDLKEDLDKENSAPLINTSSMDDDNSEIYNETSKFDAIKTLAMSIQSQVDAETKRIEEFQAKAARFKSTPQNSSVSRVADKMLPGVSNLRTHLENVQYWNRRNRACVKIQSLWRGYRCRKRLSETAKYTQDESLSEGSLSSDEEMIASPGQTGDKTLIQMNDCPSSASLSSLSSLVLSPPPDPHNFINSLAKKNLVFVANEPKTDSFHHIAYESDFNSPSSSENVAGSSRSSSISTEQVSKSNGDFSRRQKSIVSSDPSDNSVSTSPTLEPTISEGVLSSIDLRETTEQSATSVSGMSVMSDVSANEEKDSETLSKSHSNSSTLVSGSRNYEHQTLDMTICSTKPSDATDSKAGLSPSDLQRRMQIELNRLGRMDESLQKVTDINQMSYIFQTRNNTAQAMDRLERSEAHHQQEINKVLQRMTEQRMQAEQRLERQLQEHGQALKDATESLAQVKQETCQVQQSNTDKVLVHQAEASQVTAEATKKLAEVLEAIKINANKYRRKYTNSNSQTSTQVSDTQSDSVRKSETLSKQSDVPATNGSEKGSHGSISVDEGATAESSSPTENISEKLSVISTSKSDSSIPEEVSGNDESVKYSITFNESISEEEQAESFRSILPSTSHHRRSLRHKDRDACSSRTDLDISSASSVIDEVISSSDKKKESMTKSSIFADHHSFEKFTMNMVNQYMKEGELRAHHQNSLLKLREKAVVEKTKAELAWLEIQKKSLKQKGADDRMPPIRKKQRGLLLRLQQEQAEIKRLKGVQKAADQERQMLFQQQEDIYKLHKTTKQIMDRMKFAALADGSPFKSLSQLSLASSVRTSRTKFTKTTPSNSTTQVSSPQSVIETEEDVSVTVEESIEEAEMVTPKSNNSVSKSATNSKSRESKSRMSLESILKDLKKIETSKRVLSKREQKLVKRKQTVEELLQWHQKLDKEEAEIREREKQVLQRLEREKRSKAQRQTSSSEGDGEKFQEGLHSISDPTIPTEQSDHSKTAPTSNIPTVMASKSTDEQTSTEMNESVEEDLPECSQQKADSFTDSIPEAKSSLSDSVSNVKTETSIKDEDGAEYSESFESDSRRSPTPATKSKTCTSTTSEASKPKLSIKSPLSPRASLLRRHHDSSGSDDSFTVSLSETASDQSDVEGRIIALRDELRRRKVEADRLKREQKRVNQERLRAKEESLKRQLEAYDKFIRQATQDLEKELESDLYQLHKTVVKPQIKHPESRRLRRQNEIGSLSQSSSEASSPPIASNEQSIFKSESSKSSSSQDEAKSESFDASSIPEKVSESVPSDQSPLNDIQNPKLSTSSSTIEEVSDLGDKNLTEGDGEESKVASLDETFVVDSPDVPSEKESDKTDLEYKVPVDEELPTKKGIKNIDELADEITGDLMAKILSDFLLGLKNISKFQQEPAKAQEAKIGKSDKVIRDFSDSMTSELFSDAFKTILSIYRKPRKVADVGTQSHSKTSPLSVSERVDMILGARQDTPPRDKTRPQDLMVLSPLLIEDNDELLSSENFPFTDAFKFDSKNAASDISPTKDVFAKDIFDNQEWFDDDFGLGGTSPKKQNVIYPAGYYREIPNKPPPPYIPPQSGPYSMPTQQSPATVSSQTPRLYYMKPLVEETPFIAVPHTEKELSDIVSKATVNIYSQFKSGVAFDDMKFCKEDYLDEQDLGIGFEGKSRIAYKTFLFDLTKKICSDILSVSNSDPVPAWKKSLKVFCLSQEPKLTDQMLSNQVKKEVLRLLHRKKPISRRPYSGSGWNAVLYLGRKKRDPVDVILADELKEEEDEWSAYDAEELIIKEQLVDALMDEAFDDAISIFKNINLNKFRGQAR